MKKLDATTKPRNAASPTTAEDSLSARVGLRSVGVSRDRNPLAIQHATPAATKTWPTAAACQRRLE